MEMTFDIRAHAEPALAEQLAAALEKRTSHGSRTQYPRLWAVTDRLLEWGNKPAPRRKWFGGVLLAVGIFMMIPGWIKPLELLPVSLAGLAAVLLGIWRLMPRAPGRDAFHRAARQLLEQMSKIGEDQFRLTFSEDGMTITNRVTGTTLAVPFENFECVVETRDLFLLIYDAQATVLAKADLRSGTMDAFCRLLEARVRLLKAG